MDVWDDVRPVRGLPLPPPLMQCQSAGHLLRFIGNNAYAVDLHRVA